MRKPRPGEGRKLPKVPSQVLQWHSASSLLRIVVPHFLPSHQMELFVAPQTWFLRAFSFHMKQELILESQIHSSFLCFVCFVCILNIIVCICQSKTHKGTLSTLDL